MSNEKDPLSILIVSGSKIGVESITDSLSTSQFSPIISVSSAGEARRFLISKPVDIVIINAPLKDEPGTRFALDVVEAYSAGILLIVKSELYEQTSFAVENYGILTLPKPTSKQAVYQAVKFLIAMRAKLRSYEEKTISIQAKMEEIRIINRAKLLLIEHMEMGEPDAHRYIEKLAMDSCITRREVAQRIISTYEYESKF